MLRVEYARWDQTPADLRELAMSASHPRTRERFLALYEITQESCATRVAERTRRHPQTVMEWLHLYNIRGPEAISAPAPPLPGGKPRRDSPCGPTIRRSSAGSRSRSATALDPAPSGRLGARAVRPDLLPRDDPRRPASPGIVVEEEAARPIRSAGMSSRSRISSPVPSATAISWSTWTKRTSTRMPISALAGRSAAGASGLPRPRRVCRTSSRSTAFISTTKAKCGSGLMPAPTASTPSMFCADSEPNGPADRRLGRRLLSSRWRRPRGGDRVTDRPRAVARLHSCRSRRSAPRGCHLSSLPSYRRGSQPTSDRFRNTPQSGPLRHRRPTQRSPQP